MFKKTISSLMMTFFIVGLFGSITGCNTMSGAGKDIEKGGEKIQEKADEHK